MEKPSTLHLPSPDQAISARWLTNYIRGHLVNPALSRTRGRKVHWAGYNKALLDMATAIQRRARTQAAQAFRKAQKKAARK